MKCSFCLAALVLLLILAVGMLAGCGCSGSGGEKTWSLMDPIGEPQDEPKQYDSSPEMIIGEDNAYRAVIVTDLGDIHIELFADEVPQTVNNFVFLSLDQFYNNCPVHRVMEDVLIQTGDPTGTGNEGPGYDFADEEFSGEYVEGTVAMANRGADTNGSQFFIIAGNIAENPDVPEIPGNYTIFGKVTKGIEVVKELSAVSVEARPENGELSVPTVDIHLEIIDIFEGE